MSDNLSQPAIDKATGYATDFEKQKKRNEALRLEGERISGENDITQRNKTYQDTARRNSEPTAPKPPQSPDMSPLFRPSYGAKTLLGY